MVAAYRLLSMYVYYCTQQLIMLVLPADILEAPGSTHLIVTHKSMMRAFLCTALGLSPTSFRAVDIHNGGISIFRQAYIADDSLPGSLKSEQTCKTKEDSSRLLNVTGMFAGSTNEGSQC